MIYVGIDIAKLNHFAAAISSDGEILMEPFKFTNDGDGFQLLLSKLEFLSLEDDNLTRYLVASNFNVCILNPIKTSSMLKTTFAKPRRIRSTLTSLLKL